MYIIITVIKHFHIAGLTPMRAIKDIAYELTIFDPYLIYNLQQNTAY